MMQKQFRTQKILLIAFIAMVLLAFIYALAFMTEYQNLFGLRLPLNQDVSAFHDVALQSFNRTILAWALGGIGLIALAFALETFSTLPDRFALFMMLIGLAVLTYGCISNLQAIPPLEETYRNMDITYLELEGLSDYQLNFIPFNIGKAIYILHIVVNVCLDIALVLSHLYGLREKKEALA